MRNEPSNEKEENKHEPTREKTGTEAKPVTLNKPIRSALEDIESPPSSASSTMSVPTKGIESPPQPKLEESSPQPNAVEAVQQRLTVSNIHEHINTAPWPERKKTFKPDGTARKVFERSVMMVNERLPGQVLRFPSASHAGRLYVSALTTILEQQAHQKSPTSIRQSTFSKVRSHVPYKFIPPSGSKVSQMSNCPAFEEYSKTHQKVHHHHDRDHPKDYTSRRCSRIYIPAERLRCHL